MTETSPETKVGRIATRLLSLSARFVALTGLLFVEAIALSVWLDTATITGGQGLTRLVADWAPTIVRVGVAVVVMGFVFARPGATQNNLRATSTVDRPVSWSWMAIHFAALAMVIALGRRVFASANPDQVLLTVWLVSGVFTGLAAALALVPGRIWLTEIRARRGAIAVTIAAGVAACLLATLATQLWSPLRNITFLVVQSLLSPVVDDLLVDPATATLGTSRFHCEIASECSGLEGIGLATAMASVVLLAFRDEFRFPRALLLVPLAAGAMWLLNVLRIAALILIGDAGYERIALGGFHSQAGWIAFNLVALGLLSVARRLPWFTHEPAAATHDERFNPTLPYLVPFLVVAASGMISQALSSGALETWYPLRLSAGIIGLWFYRETLLQLDWRFSWRAIAWGVLAFVVWLALAPDAASDSTEAMVSQLSSLSPTASYTWLVLRVLAAVVTVPVVEELAFRGFLFRRCISAEFDQVDWRAFSWGALLTSSLVFGVMHGDRWFSGAIAGACYAMSLHDRGRIGDASAAHGVTNGLLMAWVLSTGRWQAW